MNVQFPKLPQATVIKNGYTYVPMRSILEQSGAIVKSDGKAQKLR
ncbi:hypothetical protein EBB45_19940 [Lysinibacillus composti]|uniref:Copper amine oxidase-like N-terminal domain-containing protein n=1 Tax=Lysinibacillus composti TaxID=720633 RepID=A0A3N9U1J6_9BACI|nr:hypothetical protein EBB45_19940 [Lysinibacillus composti]